MKYMGSKFRFAKQILPIILKDRKPGQYYVEPFCGGCNMIDKVNGNRIANDINIYLIELIKALQTGWLPPKDISKDEYLHMKNNIDQYPKHLVGYAGFQLSYGATWFGVYRRDNEGKRNYSHEAYRSIVKQAPLLMNVELSNASFDQMNIPENSIIYCDPPYANTSKYAVNKGSFDHDKFWEWVRLKTKEGHQVFVSEFNAPDDFECIWSLDIKRRFGKNTDNRSKVEKLFIYKGLA